MNIHHLNCASTHAGQPYPSVTHCLLLETSSGLVLVDSGYSLQDYTHPSARIRWFMRLNGTRRQPGRAASQQILRLGRQPSEVRHILLTHLHLDHACGVRDFPAAEVHVFDIEYSAARRPRPANLIERFGYVPEVQHAQANWHLHSLAGDTWFGLPAIPVLAQADCELLLVPLAGHSAGHCGVAVRNGARWLLHCGDAYMRQVQVDPLRPRSPLPAWLRPFLRPMFPEAAIRRLIALRQAHGSQIEMFCSHDPGAFARLSGAPLAQVLRGQEEV